MKGMRRVKPFEQSEGEEVQGHISFAVFPLALLLFLVFSLLWWDGGGFAPDNHLYSLTSWRNVLTSSENGIWILFLSSVLAFSSSLLLAVAFSKQSAKNVLAVLGRGVRSAGLPIMILVLARSLKEICDQMNTGEFIVESLSGKVSPQWLPLTIFFISAVTAFSTGTSWGTMAILIPTVTPLAVTLGGGEYGVFICLCLASILDGAIMGDHCSPISDTTIMSSISTDCDLLNHVRTQLPYSLVVGGLAVLFGYLPAGMGWSLSLTVPFSLVVMVGLFWFLKNSSYKKGSAS